MALLGLHQESGFHGGLNGPPKGSYSRSPGIQAGVKHPKYLEPSAPGAHLCLRGAWGKKLPLLRALGPKPLLQQRAKQGKAWLTGPRLSAH